MRVAFSVSSLGHAAVIGWGLVTLSYGEAYETTPQPPLPIEILTISEFTELTAGSKDGDKELPPAAAETVEAETPAKEPAPEPKPETKAEAAPAPAPEPEPAPLRTAALPDAAETAPEPAPKAEEPAPQPLADAPIPKTKPKVAAKPKPTPPAPKPDKQFDADNIAALLNKIPDAGGGAPTQTTSPTPSYGVATGTQGSLTMSEIDALRAQIARCWNPPVGVVDAGQLQVRIGMDLNLDGSLASPPRILNASSDPIFTVAAEAAMRAVNRCQPYSLPPEKYDSWQQIHMTFDPRELMGG